MELEDLFPCPQQPSALAYSEQVESRTQIHTLFFNVDV